MHVGSCRDGRTQKSVGAESQRLIALPTAEETERFGEGTYDPNTDPRAIAVGHTETAVGKKCVELLTELRTTKKHF